MLDPGRRNHRWRWHARRNELLQPSGTQDRASLVRTTAQHELYAALCARQLQLLGIFWSEQHRDHIDLLRLALGIGLYRLPSGQYLDILQYSLSERGIVAAGGRERHQHINFRSRIKKTGYAHQFIGSDRRGAHSFRYFSGKPYSGALDAQVP